jgi:acyl-CoA synthetase (AMP-forming)/AMP-acid ligase II
MDHTTRCMGSVKVLLLSRSCAAEILESKYPPMVNTACTDAPILRTSGTTSEPKIVPLKMHDLVSNAQIMARSLGLTPNDVALIAMPLFYIGAIASNLMSTLASGSTVVVMPSFDVQDFCDVLKTGRGSGSHMIRPTWCSAVPTMHSVIYTFAKSEMESETDRFDHSLRFIRTGAAAVSFELAQEIEDAVRVPVVPTYSMTELMPISQPPTGYHMFIKKPRSVGQPLVASMLVVGPDLKPLAYEGNSGFPVIGEICIAGNPKANASAFFVFGGVTWFRTGDLGRLDRDGFLYITGCRKDMLKRGGYQVSPVGVEDILDTHPVIKKAIVFAAVLQLCWKMKWHPQMVCKMTIVS